MLHVVTKQGIYRHEIVGIYWDMVTSIKKARKAVENESDDYHEFHISRCWVDTDIEDVKLYMKVRKHNDKIIMEFADDIDEN